MGQRGQSHDNSWRAETALQPVLVAQRLLYRMQRAIGPGQSLHGRDLTALRLDRQHQTRAHGQSIDHDRARPTNTVLAADMDTGTAHVDTEEVAQGLPPFHRGLDLTAIEGEIDLVLAHAACLTSRAARKVCAKIRRPTVRRYSAVA